MQHVLPRSLIAAVAVLGLIACASEKTGPAARPADGGFTSSVESSPTLIYVTPVEGVNGPAAMIMADAIAAALRDAGKPAVLAEKINQMGPTVSGRVADVQVRDSVLWVTAVWALKAANGTPVAEYRHQIVVDRKLWERGSAEAINLLVSDASPMVAGLVRDYVGPVALAPVPVPPPTPPPAPQSAEMPAATPAASPAATPAATPAGKSEPAPADPAAPAVKAEPAKPVDIPAAQPAAKAAATAQPAAVDKAAAGPEPEAAPPSLAKARSARPKSIARRSSISPQGPAAKKPDDATVAGAPEDAEPAAPSAPAAARSSGHAAPVQPAAKEPAKEPDAGRPTLLSKSPPPKPAPPARSPGAKLKPVEEAAAETPAPRRKPVLMPVPDDKSGLIPDPPAVAWTRPSFLIKPVEGAPGDGNVSLTNAIKSALRKRDLTVTEDPRQAGYVIEGRVQVGPTVNGRQQAKITWAVNTITGQEVGKAVQENAVKAGSLDGPWGRIADIVTNAAVVGIQELFGVDAKQSSRLDLPPVPPMPALPREPGRAPPPL